MAQPDDHVAPTEAAGSLRKRIEKGGAIFVGGFGVRQIIRLGSNLILTRLLMPEAFGLIAAAMAINIFATMVTDIGIGNSVIRSHNSNNPAFLRTAWTIRIIRNVFVWGVIAILAVAVSMGAQAGLIPAQSNFANPVLPWIMVMVGSDLLVTALGSLNKTMAERKLAVKKVILVEVLQQIFMTVVTISGAYAGMGVWALVLGILAGSAFGSVTSHLVFAGPRMGFQWDRAYATEILNFGKWLILASLFGFITNRGDQVIFGWVMTEREFGLYAVATIWITAAFQLLETITRRVFYPAYSEVLRLRPQNIGKAYGQSRLLLDLAAAFLAFSGYFLADPILDFIYPEEFGRVSYYLKLMLPIIILFPYRLINYVILADGNSKIFTLITFVTSVAMIIGAPIVVTQFGVKAGVIFIASLRLAALPVAFGVARKVFPVDWLAESRIFALAIVLITLLVRL